MKTYVWYHKLSDELLLSNNKSWNRKSISLWSDNGYWIGPMVIVKHDFLFLGEL